MITLKEIKLKKDEFEAKESDGNKLLSAFLQWMESNRSQMNAEAEDYLEGVISNFLQLAAKRISERLDSPENRKSFRKANKGLGKHWDALQLIEVFNRPHEDQDELYQEWFLCMTNALQLICDYLFDIRLKKISGSHMVYFGLLTACVDELIAYTHLARYRYFTQANAHLRTVYETKELIEFLIEKPDMLEKWFSKNYKDRLVFSPKAMRTALGKDKHDPVYTFLCEHGTHATSESFSHRALQGGSPENSTIAYVAVGGTKRVDVRINSYTMGLVVTDLILGCLISTFDTSLNYEEVELDLSKQAATVTDFFTKHFVPWAKENDLDADELAQEIASFRSDFIK